MRLTSHADHDHLEGFLSQSPDGRSDVRRFGSSEDPFEPSLYDSICYGWCARIFTVSRSMAELPAATIVGAMLSQHPPTSVETYMALSIYHTTEPTLLVPHDSEDYPIELAQEVSDYRMKRDVAGIANGYMLGMTDGPSTPEAIAVYALMLAAAAGITVFMEYKRVKSLKRFWDEIRR